MAPRGLISHSKRCVCVLQAQSLYLHHCPSLFSSISDFLLKCHHLSGTAERGAVVTDVCVFTLVAFSLLSGRAAELSVFYSFWFKCFSSCERLGAYGAGCGCVQLCCGLGNRMVRVVRWRLWDS